MKAVIAAVVMALAMLCSPAAKAWNCPSGQIRQQAPAGTPTNTPSYDVVEGIAFICVPVDPPKPTSPNITNTNSSNSSSASNSSANSSSNSGALSTAKATGGTAISNATGGQGGAGGSVANSGNSSNTNVNTNVAQGGQGGSAKQGQVQSQSVSDSGNSSSSADGNGNNSNNSTFNQVRQVATAYAPSVAPTVPCFKGFGAGAQSGVFGASFGGGKIDSNCAILEASRQAPSLLARCKVYISNKYVAEAGVTLEDCMLQQQPTITVEQGPATVVPEPQPIVVNVPAAQVQVVEVPVPAVVVPVAKVPVALPVVHQHRAMKPCVLTPQPKVWGNDEVDRMPEPSNCE